MGALESFQSLPGPSSQVWSLPPPKRKEKPGSTGTSGQVGLPGTPVMAAWFLRTLPLAMPQAQQGTLNEQLSVELSSLQPGLWQGGLWESLRRGSVPLTLPPPLTPELLQPSCAGGPGVLSEQQVLGGLSWQEVRARHQRAGGQPRGRCSQWGRRPAPSQCL